MFFSDKEDKIDLINPSTPTSASILPSASLGVATVDVDQCSEPDAEVKLEKVIIHFRIHIETALSHKKLKSKLNINNKYKSIKTIHKIQFAISVSFLFSLNLICFR